MRREKRGDVSDGGLVKINVEFKYFRLRKVYIAKYS